MPRRSSVSASISRMSSGRWSCEPSNEWRISCGDEPKTVRDEVLCRFLLFPVLGKLTQLALKRLHQLLIARNFLQNDELETLGLRLGQLEVPFLPEER